MTSPRTPRQWGPRDSEPDRSLTLQDQDRDLIAYNFDEARGNVGWRYTWIAGHETYYGGVPWSEFDESSRVAWPLSEVLPETPEPPREDEDRSTWQKRRARLAGEDAPVAGCGCCDFLSKPAEGKCVYCGHPARTHQHYVPVPASQSVPAVPVSSTGGKEAGEAAEGGTESVDRAHAALGGPSPTTDAELHALTPDQLEKCVHRALKARDVQAVEGYLLLMALKDPHRAGDIVETLKVGVRLSEERAIPEPTEGHLAALSGEALRDVEERDDAAGDLP